MKTAMPRTYRAYTRRDLDGIANAFPVSREMLEAMKAVSAVLPFRVNNYVLEELISWTDLPDDPIFQLTFPQEGMLAPEDFRTMRDLVREGAPEERIRAQAREIQEDLNPHPAGQMDLNVPRLDGEPVAGLQHKYRETILFFPSQGQTCHAYCSYCFRWAQFVGDDELKFAAREADTLVRYVEANPDVTDVLVTGGDPMIMKTRVLRAYIEPLLALHDRPATIRLGTKAPAYWPYRFVTDDDADDLLRLFEQVVDSGRHLALMAHFSHPREMQTEIAQEAIRRIRATGAEVRCQAPLIRRVNDRAETWREMWEQQVRLGAIPYYMFVERDTGPKNYFDVPLARAFDIFSDAYRRVSGLARTVRGPSMSATPGKVLVDGVCYVGGQHVFLLKFIQARNPAWVGKVFHAEYDEAATWLDELTPAFGADHFFFEPAPAHPQPAAPANKSHLGQVG